jgi:hypothetical protein
MADTEIIPMIDLGPYLAGSRLTPRWQGDGTVRDQQVAGVDAGDPGPLRFGRRAGGEAPLPLAMASAGERLTRMQPVRLAPLASCRSAAVFRP